MLLLKTKELQKVRLFVPPGNFYSPIPSDEDIAKGRERIFRKPIEKIIPGVELRESEQLALLSLFKEYYDEIIFPEYKQDNLRYFFENPVYSYDDAIFYTA